jgi:hypothetical protein
MPACWPGAYERKMQRLINHTEENGREKNLISTVA